MTTVIIARRQYGPLLLWLQNNIGRLLHSKPMLFWHGEGWHMKRIKFREVDINRPGDYGYSVDFDNEEQATWFALLWG